MNKSVKIESYLNDPDLMRVAHNAASSFTGSLSKDEIQSCIMTAIWRASKTYDKRQKTKFTSYLHKGVVYECLSQRKFNRSGKGEILHHNTEDLHNPLATVDMVDAINAKCDDPELITDRFYNRMTIKEIADKNRVSKNTIRNRLNKNIEKLRDLIQNSV